MPHLEKNWMKKRQGVPANEEQKILMKENQQLLPNWAKSPVWRCRSKWAGCGASRRMKGSGPTQQPRGDEHLNPQHHGWGSQSLWPRSLLGFPMQWVPSYLGRWSTEPMGGHLQSSLRSIWRRPRRCFLATCSLQLPWEVQERTQSGSPCSYTLKAQESFATSRARLCFSSFSLEKNFVLFYNFLEIAVISEKMQNEITKVFYSLKHKIF